MRFGRVLLGLVMLLGCFGVTGAMAQQETSTEAKAQEQAEAGKPAYSLSPEKLARAIEYSRKRVVLGFVDTAWGILQLVLLLTLGVAAWMRKRAVSVGTNRWAQGFVFLFLFMVISTLLELPLDLYVHHLSLAYGQSVQGWGSWFGDQAKSFGLTYGVGIFVVMLLFLVIKKSPTKWWFWFWIPAMLFVVFGVFISPVLIDPMFNKFEPLTQTNPALVQQLEQVVARGGIEIPPERMFLMKASEKYTGLNAYVTGVGASKRVVVWDTSIAKATPEEIQYIFGHEMGHYVLNHIYKGIAFTGVVLLVLFWLGYHGMQWLLARYGDTWDIHGQRDWGALIVLMLVISVFSFLSEPITNGYQRAQEHAADVYGQEAVHGIVSDPQKVAQAAFQVLGEESLTDPNPSPFVEFWTFSHPSIGRRAAFAAAYDPWAPGSTPKYFKK